jgi:hypothetical protein
MGVDSFLFNEKMSVKREEGRREGESALIKVYQRKSAAAHRTGNHRSFYWFSRQSLAPIRHQTLFSSD